MVSNIQEVKARKGKVIAIVTEGDVQVKEMADFATMYKNPFFNAMMTYAEILPVGVVVTLISSFVLKRKAQQ